MSKVSITELRQNLPAYLARVRKGDEIQVAVHGKVIARIVPEVDAAQAARQRLLALRKKAKVGDVVSPSGDRWEAER